ncbi:sigma-70 family RNA polymerase sigma factor [Sphingobacterium oryzagri]|uniref:Sigma-70 family RNA polymerase sigma factor n=1 Tax=Sphingobacterium oryzagri TaxID=3025669 RepID=A0ABY7WCD2_9SPHI|nr:sigma-70 family RNA polymerase sigma factor [Sphingobacterium sp. KACC 22765]WDF67327.1 sigma-70 family RNA polymerase sigma factor [Sphingobacterium sp. KACC 22765]
MKIAGPNKSEAEFEQLVNDYYGQLCSFSVQYTNSLPATEDIVQDVLLKLLENKHHLAGKDNLKSYTFRSVRNASIDFIRKNRTHLFTALEEASYLSEEEVTEDVLREKHEKLHQLLEQLPRQEHRALIAVFVENKSYKTVAGEMGISINTVKTHLSRAMKYLRKHNIKISAFLFFY